MKKYSSPVKQKMAKILITGTALLAITFLLFIIPLRPEVSLTEKRELAKFPEFSFAAFTSGDYFSDISAWFSDTVPFRDTLVALNAKIQNFLGTSTAQAGFNEGVKGDDIPDAPVKPVEITTDPSAEGTSVPDETAVSEMPTDEPTTLGKVPDTQAFDSVLVAGNAAYEYYNFRQDVADAFALAINTAASRYSGRATVYSMIIPTSMDITLDKRIRSTLSVSDQQKAINYMYGSMTDSVKKVDIFNTMLSHADEYIYFRADHHWTGLGAYYAYVDFCNAKGISPLPLSSYTVRSFDNFLGSFYNDSGMNSALAQTPDVVDTYTPPCNTSMTVTDASGNSFETPMIYDATTNRPAYKYSAFIYGDNPFTVIENLDKTDGESIILVKESFGNAIAPLLTYHYKYVYVVDYRYCDTTVSALIDEYGVTDVLFCNNISMTRSSAQVSKLSSHIG